MGPRWSEPQTIRRKIARKGQKFRKHCRVFRQNCTETWIRCGNLLRLSFECRYTYATWRHVAASQGNVEPKFPDSAAIQRDLAWNVPATGSCFGKPGDRKGRLRQCIDTTRQHKPTLRQCMDIPDGYELVSRRLGVARGISSLSPRSFTHLALSAPEGRGHRAWGFNPR